MSEPHTIPELRDVRIAVDFSEPWDTLLSPLPSQPATIIAVRWRREGVRDQVFFELDRPIPDRDWIYHWFAASPRYTNETLMALLNPAGYLITNHHPVTHEMVQAQRWDQECDQYVQQPRFFYGAIKRI